MRQPFVLPCCNFFMEGSKRHIEMMPYVSWLTFCDYVDKNGQLKKRKKKETKIRQGKGRNRWQLEAAFPSLFMSYVLRYASPAKIIEIYLILR